MKKRWWTIWLVPFLIASAALIGILLYRRRRAHRRWRVPRPDLVEIQGLSEAEAAARQTEDPVQERRRAMRQVRRGIWRDNILSIFVLDMVGLTVANWLLGAPLSALISFGILCLNVGINVGQELLAVRWIERVLERAHPLTTVIRDGQVKSIIQDEIVVGDALVIGPGDQILADGQVRSSADLLTSKSAFASQEQATSQRVGDSLSAGGYCVRGWAVYEVEALPRGGLGVTSFRVSPGAPGQKTPLQRIVDRVLRGMLGLVALFLGLLVLDLVGWGGV